MPLAVFPQKGGNELPILFLGKRCCGAESFERDRGGREGSLLLSFCAADRLPTCQKSQTKIQHRTTMAGIGRAIHSAMDSHADTKKPGGCPPGSISVKRC